MTELCRINESIWQGMEIADYTQQIQKYDDDPSSGLIIAKAADPMRRTTRTFFIVETMVDAEFDTIAIRDRDDLSADSYAMDMGISPMTP